jgi:hypothetical protein
MVITIHVSIHVENKWEGNFIVDFDSFEGVVIKIESSKDDAE